MAEKIERAGEETLWPWLICFFVERFYRTKFHASTSTTGSAHRSKTYHSSDRCGSLVP
jgi:hypothetical protein